MRREEEEDNMTKKKTIDHSKAVEGGQGDSAENAQPMDSPLKPLMWLFVPFVLLITYALLVPT